MLMRPESGMTGYSVAIGGTKGVNNFGEPIILSKYRFSNPIHEWIKKWRIDS